MCVTAHWISINLINYNFAGKWKMSAFFSRSSVIYNEIAAPDSRSLRLFWEKDWIKRLLLWKTLWICLFVCLFIGVFVGDRFVCRSVYLSVFRFVYLSVCLCLCLFVSLYVTIMWFKNNLESHLKSFKPISSRSRTFVFEICWPSMPKQSHYKSNPAKTY